MEQESSFTIDTRCGVVRLRRRGAIWFARKQSGKIRYEMSMKTDNVDLAISRAQEMLPASILGIAEFKETGSSVATKDDYMRTINSAKKRAKASGVEFSLSEIEIESLIKSSNGMCALTGIPFSLSKPKDSFRAPFAPSLDQIYAGKGYKSGNVRLVCVAVNWALSDWGFGVFEAIAFGFSAKAMRELSSAKTGQLL